MSRIHRKIGTFAVIGTLLATSCFFHEHEQPRYREPTPVQMQQLEKIYDAIGEKIEYKEDVISIPIDEKYRKTIESFSVPREKWGLATTLEISTDYFQLPSETLQSGKGDCEDLAILFATCAEILGADTIVYDGETTTGPHRRNGIYHQGKWKPIDVTSRVPFEKSIKHPEEFSPLRINYSFDESMWTGEKPIDVFYQRMEHNIKKELNRSVITFRENFGRDPNEQEMIELGEFLAYMCNEIIKNSRVPDDPTVFIQLDNPKVNDWVKSIISSNTSKQNDNPYRA